jgi:hypothetical protein
VPILTNDQAIANIANPAFSPTTSRTYPQIGCSMIAPWNVPTIHEYCCAVMCRSWRMVGAATPSVLRVR